MQYLLLVFTPPDGPAEPGVAVGDGRYEVEAGGHLVDGAPLQPESCATTVRVRGGRTLVRDGPVTPGNARLAAFLLLTARDLYDAVRTAARMPAARTGFIEVRLVHEPVAPHNAEETPCAS